MCKTKWLSLYLVGYGGYDKLKYEKVYLHVLLSKLHILKI